MKKSELFFAFILLPIDIAMIIAGFVLAYYFRVTLEVVPAASSIPLSQYLRYTYILIPIWVLLFALNGLYYLRSTKSLYNIFYRIFTASSVAMLFLILEIFFTKTNFFSRLIMIFAWVLTIILITLGRAIVRAIQVSLYRVGWGKRNLLLVGDNSTSSSIAKTVLASNASPYRLKGTINGQSGESKYGLKILGPTEELHAIIEKYKIDEVILTDFNTSRSKIMEMIQICSDHKVTFKYIPDVFSYMTFSSGSELIGSMPVMELRSIPLDGWGRIVKRVLDIVFSALLLLVTSPLLLLIAILVKATSRGPVFFSHDRTGRDEKVFKFYKFRSMYSDKCDWKQKGVWTTADDDKNRITPLGRIIRKTNLDELPQLYSILKGDMSFIGPRPEQPKLVEKFENEIPEYFRRHKVKSGLTGWAQVNGLKGDTSIRERVRYDMYYIENWSLWLDIKIIFKTIGIIIYEIFSGKFEYRTRP